MTVSHLASLAATLGNYRQMTGVESTTTTSSCSSREMGTTMTRLCDISGDRKHDQKNSYGRFTVPLFLAVAVKLYVFSVAVASEEWVGVLGVRTSQRRLVASAVIVQIR